MSDEGSSVGSDAAGDIYGRLAWQHPNRTALGGALITMVEPDPGYERTYNRWYEDDHFYSGAMMGLWAFAGARWVATRRLQLLRYPSRSRIAIPVTAGCYLSAFGVTKGHLDEYEEWSATLMREVLYPEGRGFDHRTHIYSGFHSLASPWSGSNRCGWSTPSIAAFPDLSSRSWRAPGPMDPVHCSSGCAMSTCPAGWGGSAQLPVRRSPPGRYPPEACPSLGK